VAKLLRNVDSHRPSSLPEKPRAENLAVQRESIAAGSSSISLQLRGPATDHGKHHRVIAKEDLTEPSSIPWPAPGRYSSRFATARRDHAPTRRISKDTGHLNLVNFHTSLWRRIASSETIIDNRSEWEHTYGNQDESRKDLLRRKKGGADTAAIPTRRSLFPSLVLAPSP